MANESGQEASSSGILIGILIVVVIAIVAWIAYAQGFFGGKQANPDNGNVQINLGGTPAKSTPAPAY